MCPPSEVVLHSNVLPKPSSDASFYIGDDADFSPEQLEQLVLNLEQCLTASWRSGSRGEFPDAYEKKMFLPGESLLSDVYRVSRDRAADAGSFGSVTTRANPCVSIIRLYVTTYFPSGFWPRLITRLLDDSAFATFATSLYDFSPLAEMKYDGAMHGMNDRLLRGDEELRLEMDSTVWRCWQTGVELLLFGRLPILRLKEASESSSRDLLAHYESCELSVDAQDGQLNWTPVNMVGKSVLEVLVPNEALVVEGRRDAEGQRRVTVIYPKGDAVAALLAKSVEIVDTLLEDWYPDLGHRLVLVSAAFRLIVHVPLALFSPEPFCLSLLRVFRRFYIFMIRHARLFINI